MSTTFNLPNFVGELYGLTPTDTPFLSMAGGLTGGESVDATIFPWTTYDLRSVSELSNLEGADAPTASARVRGTAFNTLSIIHETIYTSYTKQAAVGQYDATGSAHTYADGVNGGNRVLNEHNWQTMQMIKQIARDVDYTFLMGTLQEPSDNNTARQTRGIVEACSTNAIDESTQTETNTTGEADDEIFTEVAHGLLTGDQIRITSITGGTGIGLVAGDCAYVEKIGADTFYLTTSRTGATAGRYSFTTDVSDLDWVQLTEPTYLMVMDLMQDIWDQGGIQEDETRTIFVNSGLKRYLTKILITDQGYSEQSRNVGGVNVTSFETDFGRCNIALERHLRKDVLLVASMEQVTPVHLLIPEKGFLFIEELGKAGAAFKHQIYGETGLKYGNEQTHGVLTGLHAFYNPAA
ncbi:MAG: DUF5309 family protein [Actinomycetota bacterium]